jgi:hypothetical protein
MLSEVLWLVVVWIVWTGIFVLIMMLVRWSMRGQQEIVSDQEAEITAARATASDTESGLPRWSLGGPKPMGPPISAT